MLFEEVAFQCGLTKLLMTLLQNKSLAEAIYMGKWYKLEVEASTNYSYGALRETDCGKILDLTLDTFTTVA
jgi:hypothetical protein